LNLRGRIKERNRLSKKANSNSLGYTGDEEKNFKGRKEEAKVASSR